MPEKYALLPLFNTVKNIAETAEETGGDIAFWKSDYRNGLAFLINYNGSEAAFNAYLCELERLLHQKLKLEIDVFMHPFIERERSELETRYSSLSTISVGMFGASRTNRSRTIAAKSSAQPVSGPSIPPLD